MGITMTRREMEIVLGDGIFAWVLFGVVLIFSEDFWYCEIARWVEKSESKRIEFLFFFFVSQKRSRKCRVGIDVGNG